MTMIAKPRPRRHRHDFLCLLFWCPEEIERRQLAKKRRRQQVISTWPK
jgi:hypothetical protein